MSSTLRSSVLALLFFTLVTSYSLISLEKQIIPSRPAIQSDEALYLPNGTALSLISFGYQNALSQLLWFDTISYFGKHFRQDQSYVWLKHMCSLVTALNPKNKDPFVFCAAMLAWEARDVEGANTLLSRAIASHPEDWYLLYLRGFNYTYFLKDQERALRDFVTASKIPGHHPLVTRLAAKKMAELDTPETAIEFLEDALGRTSDQNARRALLGKLSILKKSGGSHD